MSSAALYVLVACVVHYLARGVSGQSSFSLSDFSNAATVAQLLSARTETITTGGSLSCTDPQHVAWNTALDGSPSPPGRMGFSITMNNVGGAGGGPPACSSVGVASTVASGLVSSVQQYSFGDFSIYMRTGHATEGGTTPNNALTCFSTFVGTEGGTMQRNEISLCFSATTPTQVDASYWIGQVANGDAPKTTTIPLGFDATQTYHTYGFRWRSIGIQFLVDGVVVLTTSGDVLGYPWRAMNVQVLLRPTGSIASPTVYLGSALMSVGAVSYAAAANSATFGGSPTLSPTPLLPGTSWAPTAPSNAPSPGPTAATPAPTARPSAGPTIASRSPTPLPTLPWPSALPTSPPSAAPSPRPSSAPSAVPSPAPTRVPSSCIRPDPSISPTPRPTSPPSTVPSPLPSSLPTPSPTANPTMLPGVPTPTPTALPTRPSPYPTVLPSAIPSAAPTPHPTPIPSARPSPAPSHVPSPFQSSAPTMRPSPLRSLNPTFSPTPAIPTAMPTTAPPSAATTRMPTTRPTNFPSLQPSPAPTTAAPQFRPSTMQPTLLPTWAPSPPPTTLPTAEPSSLRPTRSPTGVSQSGNALPGTNGSFGTDNLIILGAVVAVALVIIGTFVLWCRSRASKAEAEAAAASEFGGAVSQRFGDQILQSYALGDSTANPIAGRTTAQERRSLSRLSIDYKDRPSFGAGRLSAGGPESGGGGGVGVVDAGTGATPSRSPPLLRPFAQHSL